MQQRKIHFFCIMAYLKKNIENEISITYTNFEPMSQQLS